ncbi:MAG TPA: hypothetical protein VMS77_00480 [Conexivisphaerales archaeon]|nr:hypothetical protein [Conexivisphaerales archaeon]
MDDRLAKEFKQLVLARRGKLELSSEGEAALRLYIEKHKEKNAGPGNRQDPLAGIVGALKTGGRHDALDDLRKLETEN